MDIFLFFKSTKFIAVGNALPFLPQSPIMEVENYPILEVAHLGGTRVSTSMIMGRKIFFPTALVVEKHQMYLIYIGPTGKMILPKNQQGPFVSGVEPV